jgi:hypothetical protein
MTGLVAFMNGKGYTTDLYKWNNGGTGGALDLHDYAMGGDAGALPGNWVTEWQSSHTVNVDWYDCGAAHSQSLNANQKAYTACTSD